MSKRVILSIASLFLLWAAPAAHAGTKYESAYCYRAPDGSGYCYGSLRGFRYEAGMWTLANFQITSAGLNGNPGFSGYYGNSAMSCVVPAASPLLTIWPTAMAIDGYFTINWNSAAECTYLVLGNGSAYKDGW